MSAPLLLAAILAGGSFPVRQCQTQASYAAYGPVGVYQAPVVAQPYGYGHGYGFNQAYVDKVLFVATQPYYSAIVGDGQRATNAANAATADAAGLAAQVGSLAAAVSRLEARIGAATTPTGTPPAAPSPGPSPAPTPPSPPPPTPSPALPPATPRPPDPIVPPGAPTELDVAAAKIVRNLCAKCHSGDSAKGGLRIFDTPTSEQFSASLTVFDKAKIHAVGYQGEWDGNTMPPDGTLMKPEEFSSVAAWFFQYSDEYAAAIKACQEKGK